MLDHSDETISIHGYSGEDPLAVMVRISEIYHKIIKMRFHCSRKGNEATSSSEVSPTSIELTLTTFSNKH